jgi:poly-gamma-glutamate synthesis protein (capsule biosynthesis protein)
VDELPAATVIIVGDIMLGRQVNIEMAKRDDYSWPFHQISDLLRDADFSVGNLEAPIVSGCPFSSEGMIFCAVPRSAEGLAWAGIDGVSLANNHATTYGKSGLDETVSYLQQAGVQPILAGMMTVRTVNGIRIGVLSFNDSDTELDLDHAGSVTRASSLQVDILIGLLHWGVEYQAEPTPRQREVGHRLVDAGMDVIAGSHPHRTQPVEACHGKLIAYSLGNFVFDQMWWEETRRGEVMRLQLTKTLDGMTISYEMTRIEIFDYGQPAVTQQELQTQVTQTPTGISGRR